jgi:hypothetical protein
MRSSSTIKTFGRPIYPADETGNRYPKTWFKINEDCPELDTMEVIEKPKKPEFEFSYM